MAIVKFTNYKHGQSSGGMRAVMRYTKQDKKTLWEGRQLVTGINCQPEKVYEDFMTTKRLYHKTDGVLFYHMVQSFPKGEAVDPLAAHAAALKLAEYYTGHEVLVCTHTDRDHIHSHFIINSVNFDTGRKLHMAKDQLQELRQRNDKICIEFALPVFQPKRNQKKTKPMTTREYHVAARGQSKKFQLMNMINDCMRHARNKDEFIALMEGEGYKVRWERSRKNITYTTPSGWQCRDRMLFGDKYLKENMEYEFRIRDDLVRGRTFGDEPARASAQTSAADAGPRAGRSADYRTGADTHASTDYDTGASSAADDAARSTCGGDPVSHTGGAEQDGAADRISDAEQFRSDNISETAEWNTRNISNSDADGGSAEEDNASGVDDRTGWEAEREAFLSAQVPIAPAAAAALGWPDLGSPADGSGGVASALVGLGRRLEQAQYAAPVIDSTTMQYHADSKILRKEKEKKIAQGHAEDDHEEEQTWQQTM